MALLVLVLLGLGGLAWKLSAGPIELDFLARAIERQANTAAAPARLEVGHASLGWQGWREGHRTPVEIRLSGVKLRGEDGAVQAELPDAAISLSLARMLRGEIAPHLLELQRPSLSLTRNAEGQVAVQLDSAPSTGAKPFEDLLAELMRVPNDDSPMGTLARLRIQGGRLLVQDAALGTAWTLAEVAMDLRRLPEGGVTLQGRGQLRLGDQNVPVTIGGQMAGAPAETTLRLSIAELRPAALAAAVPALAPLAALDAPSRLDLALRLDATGVAMAAEATLAFGAGHLDLGAGRRLAMAGGEVVAAFTPGALSISRASLRLAGPEAPTLTGRAEALRGPAGWQATLHLALDRIRLGELGRHWPVGLVDGARAWITDNVTDGLARNGQWSLSLEAPSDLSTVRATALSGTMEIEEAVVHWLRPIPPMERGRGSVTFSLPEITLRIAGGRQRGGQGGVQSGVQVREGTARFLLREEPESLDVSLAVQGSVPDVLAVVQHPRLKLFERRPLPLTNPQGQVEGRLNIALPLLADLPMEQLRIRAQARLRDVRLADVVMGRPMSRGQFDLTVDNDGLRATGTATIAEIAGRVGVEMDFRAGPPNQVVMRESVTARTDARTLAALGLASEEMLSGPLGVEIRSERRRNGVGRVNIRADLREAAITLAPLAWAKPAGQIAGADLVLRLNRETLEAVESFRVEAPSLLLRGNAAFGPGTRLTRVTVNEAAIEASRFAGEARPPTRPGEPWGITLRGAALDLRRLLAEDAAPGPPPAEAEPGPPLSLDARFERVLLGPQRELSGVEALVRLDAQGVVREGRITGRAGPRGVFEAVIAPAAAGRSLSVTAEDAGALLGQLDVLRNLEGGRLSVTAAYAHNRPGAPLSGRAEISDFAVRGAPGFAKLLQAMTLYGLVDALSGPGLSFSQLIAPFTLTPEALTLAEARAFSPSLGLTAKGTLNRRTRRVAIEGTIVPAYFFNSLLGNIPLLGRLFSPETGGGLFAATFRLNGPADDPQVNVNPLAALTPGFLRGIFGLGQGAAAPP